jgi:ribosomal protein S12 methylthiotransferase accessory factor
MMLALQALEPNAGVARHFALVPPGNTRAPLWRVLVDIGLGDTDDYPLAYVGAYDGSRRGAVDRGIGEAIERFALAQEATPDVTGTLDELGVEAARGWPRWLDRARYGADDRAWYRGISLDDRAPALVPAPLVDDHGARRQRGKHSTLEHFDPSPSGAASGLDLEWATSSALREIIERDAVLCAWASQSGVMRVDAEPADAHTLRLLEWAEGAGMRPHFGLIASAVPGLHVVCCAVVARSENRDVVSAFGSKASASFSAAARGALQEAMQIHELLENLRATGQRPAPFDVPTADLVVDDVARAWWWTTELAAESMDSWVSTWRNDTVPRRTEALAEPTSRVMADHIISDGGSPILVDLTCRLPEAIRELGWNVVKVLCPGYQQLRLDESIVETWDPIRLASWGRRNGASLSHPHPLPHPLI